MRRPYVAPATFVVTFTLLPAMPSLRASAVNVVAVEDCPRANSGAVVEATRGPRGNVARNLRVGGGRVELQPAGSLATPDVTASGNPQVRGAIYPASATERTGHPRASPVHLLFTDAVRVRAELLRCEDASGARPNLPPRTKRGVDDGFDPPDLQSIAAFLRSSIAARSNAAWSHRTPTRPMG